MKLPLKIRKEIKGLVLTGIIFLDHHFSVSSSVILTDLREALLSASCMMPCVCSSRLKPWWRALHYITPFRWQLSRSSSWIQLWEWFYAPFAQFLKVRCVSHVRIVCFLFFFLILEPNKWPDTKHIQRIKVHNMIVNSDPKYFQNSLTLKLLIFINIMLITNFKMAG